MRQNVGVLDSTVRVGLAFGLMFAGFLLPPPASYASYVGFLLLGISGFTGKCLLYRMLGVTTCRDDDPL